MSSNTSKKAIQRKLLVSGQVSAPMTVSTKPNAMEIGTSLYEQEPIASLSEKIMFQFCYLRQLQERANILVILEHEEHASELLLSMQEKLGKAIFESIIPSKAIPQNISCLFQMLSIRHAAMEQFDLDRLSFKWSNNSNSLDVFQKNAPSPVMARSNSNLSIASEASSSESVTVLAPSSQSLSSPLLDTEETQIASSIDGLVIISKVKSFISSGLKRKLSALERFPVIFVFFGLDQCNDICDAIKQKEEAEVDVLEIYKNHFRPHIVFFQDTMFNDFSNNSASTYREKEMHCISIYTALAQHVMCKFTKESLDISLSRVINSHEQDKSEQAFQIVNQTYWKHFSFLEEGKAC